MTRLASPRPNIAIAPGSGAAWGLTENIGLPSVWRLTVFDPPPRELGLGLLVLRLPINWFDIPLSPDPSIEAIIFTVEAEFIPRARSGIANSMPVVSAKLILFTELESLIAIAIPLLVPPDRAPFPVAP